LIQRLLSKDKCEVLITFMVDSINRWLTHPDTNIKSHIVETFGTTDALGIAEGTGRSIRSHPQPLSKTTRKKAAKFVRYFAVV